MEEKTLFSCVLTVLLKVEQQEVELPTVEHREVKTLEPQMQETMATATWELSVYYLLKRGKSIFMVLFSRSYDSIYWLM